ncbi:hypothetical protein VTK56DRAFT_1685 [Thermocarpiscus australiensis]
MTLGEVNGRNVLTPKPETEEYNVCNFVYSRRRPFHPRRLWELLYDKFILQMEHPEEDEDEEQEDNEGGLGSIPDVEMTSDDDGREKSICSPSSALSSCSTSNGTSRTITTAPSSSRTFSSPPNHKNLSSVDTEMPDDLTSQQSHPLQQTHLDPLHPPLPLQRRIPSRYTAPSGGRMVAGGRNANASWRSALILRSPSGSIRYTTGDVEVDALVQHDIQKEVFDSCLLTDEEFASWKEVMREEKTGMEEKLYRLADLFEDGFPDWPEEDDEGHEGHDHGHGQGEHTAAHRIGQEVKSRRREGICSAAVEKLIAIAEI